MSAGRGIPLNYFATTADVSSNLASVNGQLANQLSSINTLNTGLANTNSTVSALSNNLASTNNTVGGLSINVAGLTSQYNLVASQINAINSELNRAMDGAAMGIAMKDAIPNDGDRFAVRANLGGLNTHAAGGISFTANVADHTRLMVNYGQSKSQSAFAGGLNFSFN